MTMISRKLQQFGMFVFCALLFFVGAVAAQAATYYVALTGNDANSCVASQTITTPKRTFASAVACVAPGDTLYIRAGTWTEQLNLGSTAGTAGAYKTFAGYPGERPCLTAKNGPGGFAVYTYGPIVSYIVLQNLKMDGTCDGTPVTSLGYAEGWSISSQSTAPHHITIINVEVANWNYHALYIDGKAHDILVQQSSFHDMYTLRPSPPDTCTDLHRWYAFYIHDAYNVTIETSDMYNNPGGGMQIYPGSSTSTNNVVRKNKIHDNQSCRPGSGFGGIIVQGTHSNQQIYNNLIYNNGSDARSGSSPGINVNGASGPVSGTKIWNNTITGNGLVSGFGGDGIDVGAGATSTTIQNNIVYNNSASSINDVGTGTISDHNLLTNPTFVNAGTFDFHLLANSPALNVGLTLGAPWDTDLDGVSRPQPVGGAYDLGAYERTNGGVSDTTPPAPPTGLTVH